jgi:hypothetical protein
MLKREVRGGRLIPKEFRDHYYSAPTARHNQLEIMAAPTSWGVGGWGLRSGPGSRIREPTPILYQFRFKLIYRKIVCAISLDVVPDKQIVGKAGAASVF